MYSTPLSLGQAASTSSVTRPALIEAGAAETLRNALKECRTRRYQIVSFAVNVALVLILGFLIWTVLSYRKRHRLDPDTKRYRSQIAQSNLYAVLGRIDRRMNNMPTW
jgi:hypothetical protein